MKKPRIKLKPEYIQQQFNKTVDNRDAQTIKSDQDMLKSLIRQNNLNDEYNPPMICIDCLLIIEGNLLNSMDYILQEYNLDFINNSKSVITSFMELAIEKNHLLMLEKLVNALKPEQDTIDDLIRHAASWNRPKSIPILEKYSKSKLDNLEMLSISINSVSPDSLDFFLNRGKKELKIEDLKKLETISKNNQINSNQNTAKEMHQTIKYILQEKIDLRRKITLNNFNNKKTVIKKKIIKNKRV